MSFCGIEAGKNRIQCMATLSGPLGKLQPHRAYLLQSPHQVYNYANLYRAVFVGDNKFGTIHRLISGCLF